jgi:hypothetical protein
MKAWLLAARAHPSSPMAFPILFLAAVARRRGIDVAAGNYAPSAYGLGMLETQLFTGALLRMPKGSVKVKAKRTAHASAFTSCSDVIDQWLSDMLAKYGYKGVAADAIKFLLTQNIKEVTKQGGKYAAGGLAYVGLQGTSDFAEAKMASGVVLDALSLLFQIERLANIYGGVRFYVNVPQPSVEKPEQFQNQAALGYGEFDAVAGLSDDLQKQYDDAVQHGGKDFTANRRAVTDCAKQLGFPVPYFDTDVAADLDKFRVQWTLHADPGDAVYEFQKTQWFAPGSRIGKLTRAAPDLAAHIFYAKVQPQQPWSYAPQLFEQRSHDASATAELQTDQALDPKMLIGIIKSEGKSLFGPLSTTILGMLEKLHTISDTGDLTITYHVPKCQGGGSLAHAAQDVCQQPMSATFSGSQVCAHEACAGGDDIRFDWTGSMVGEPYVSPFPVATGFLGWTIKSGSAHVRISGTVGDQSSGTCEVHGSTDVDLIAANGSSTPVFTLNPGTPETYQFTLSTRQDFMTVTYDNCTGGRTPPSPVTLPIGIPLVKTGAPIARPSPTGPITYSNDFVEGYSTFHYGWSITGV